MVDIYILQCLITIFIAFAVSIYAIPPIINIAYEKKLFDLPNQYKAHLKPIPRLGGLAIYVGFMTAMTLLGRMNNGVQEILAGSVIIFFIGLKDDLIPISALKKFLGQLLAAGIVMFMADIRITSFQGLLGIYELDTLNQGFSYILTFVTIIGITNAINLIDGIDGLAGTLILIIAITLGLCFLYNGKIHFALFAFALAGSVGAFLRYNIYKAQIFMGDTGSLLCGFMISVLTIEFIEMRSFTSSPVVAVSFLCIPLFDTIRVFTIRIYKGLSPFLPDRDHIYHRMLDAGLSHIATTIILSLVNAIAIIVVILISPYGNWYILTFLTLLLSLLYATVFYFRFKRKDNLESVAIK